MVMAMAATNSPERGGDVRGPGNAYESGTCNIGRDEISHRRRLAYLGLVVTLAFLVLLLVANVPPLARFSVALPAWGTAVAYLQARRRFCVAFAVRGVFNFGGVGTTQRVADPESRARDRRRALETVVHGLIVGVAAGAVAVLLPV